jgi:hypothetical protein
MLRVDHHAPSPNESPQAANDPPAAAEPRLRWYQFSLRTLLILVALCALPCSWFATRIQRAERQRKAVEALFSRHPNIVINYGDTTAPATVRRLLGDGFFVDVEQIIVCGVPGFSDSDMVYFESFPGLTEMAFIGGDGITDAGLAHLMGLSKLQNLNLSGTKVTVEGVRKLQQAIPRCQIDWDDPTAERLSVRSDPSTHSSASGPDPFAPANSEP